MSMSTDTSLDPTGKHSPSSSQDTTNQLLDTVADAQKSPTKSTAWDSSLDSQRSTGSRPTARDGYDTQRTMVSKPGAKEGAVEGLSPIRELASEEDHEDKKLSQTVSVMQDLVPKDKDENEMVVGCPLSPFYVFKNERKKSGGWLPVQLDKKVKRAKKYVLFINLDGECLQKQ